MGRIFAVIALFWAGAAFAADEPVIGPRPDWVEPTEIPDAPAEAVQSPLKLLLEDHQYRFTDAFDEEYYAFAARIQTPQGLNSVGSFGLEWRPHADTLTIHTMEIVREGETVDLLSDDAITVLRRENSLEYAMLDGVLTAALQPAGLRVGDVLHMEYTTRREDPVLDGMSQQTLYNWASSPVSLVNIRAEWDADLPIRWEVKGEGVDFSERTRRGVTEIAWSGRDVEAPTPPMGAPLRYLFGRSLEFTEFQSWADVSALLAPHYEAASRLPDDSPLHAEIARIRETHDTPKARAAAALRLVQDQVRYLFLGMNEGGLVPAHADETWERRFGDCKGKTALLLAILRELDIEAEALAVNSTFGDGMDDRLPMVAQFDHVLVRAVIDGETYWLDGTGSGDRALENIEGSLLFWGLPIRASGADLIQVMPRQTSQPDVFITTRIDATDPLAEAAPFEGEVTYSRAAAAVLQAQFSMITAVQRDEVLRQAMGSQFPAADIEDVAFEYDDEATTLTMSAEGVIDLSDGADILGLLTRTQLADPQVESLLDDERTAPFANAHPYFVTSLETVVLPDGGDGAELTGEDVNERLGATQFVRTARLEDGVFSLQTTTRSLEPEMSVSQARAMLETAREVDDRPFALIIPGRNPDADAQRRTTAMLADGDMDGMVNQFTEQLEDNPEDPQSRAARGLAHAMAGNMNAARQDLEIAALTEPDLPAVLQGRTMIAVSEGDLETAVGYLDRLIETQPNSFAYGQRAEFHRELGNLDQALADSREVTRLAPDDLEMYRLRANIYHARGDTASGLAEAEAITAAHPDNHFAHTYAGAIYATFDEDDLAAEAFGRSLAIEPSVAVYLTRASYLPDHDFDARRAAIEAALEIEPDHVQAWRNLALLERDAGRYGAAMEALDRLLEINPEDVGSMNQRGIVKTLSGEGDPAPDFDAARELSADSAPGLNNICWAKATLGVALEAALADCDAALALEPTDPSYLDSRGLVLLRLGRLEDALTEYSLALRLDPDLAHSLYGRGITRRMMGNEAAAEADIARAMEVDPGIAETFAEYDLPE